MALVFSARLNVEHCPECGSVYQTNLRQLCGACSSKMDADLQACETYLRRNRKANRKALHEATEVSMKRITRFVRSGRLSVRDYPALGYDCELCGEEISTGKLCVDCAVHIQKDIRKLMEQEAASHGETQTRKTEAVLRGAFFVGGKRGLSRNYRDLT